MRCLNHYGITNIFQTSKLHLLKGVEDRGGYYESSGALKDMVQNHMLQMVALLKLLEAPISLNSEDIRAEKVKVLKSLRHFQSEDVKKNFVRGQYGEGYIDGKQVKAYRDEDRVADDSNTPTFVSGKLTIDNFRWAGVPFYIRTG